MKILELTNYTAGGCGVGARALKEASLLKKRGHDVRVFSSNIVKGTNKTCQLYEKIDNVEVFRFSGRKLGGESYTYWNFEEEALKFRPNIIIAHAYRHFHTNIALRIAKKLKCKVFLVTHAPFDRGETRNKLDSLAVFFYDSLIGRFSLNKFDKIITISRWERPFLLRLGVMENKIVYLPNGIDEILFSPLKQKGKQELVYTGRIAPIKNLELVLEAISKTHPVIKFHLYGPAEKGYLSKLKEIVSSLKLQNRVKFTEKVYNKKEQIRYLDSARFFILPSISEGMPQVLIEAMARGRVVIASDNKGNSDIIASNYDGFLFKNNNSLSLSSVLEKAFSMKKTELDKIGKRARKTAEKFKWNKIIDSLERLF